MFIEICEKGVKGMAIIFVTGGAKSGKSKFAEELILNSNSANCLFVRIVNPLKQGLRHERF